MQLSSPQKTGQFSAIRKDLVQNANGAKVGEPCLDGSEGLQKYSVASTMPLAFISLSLMANGPERGLQTNHSGHYEPSMEWGVQHQREGSLEYGCE